MKKEKMTEKNIEPTVSDEPATPEAEVKEAEEKKEKSAKITKVGAMLKEMRQKRGAKLTDVAKVLCIRKFYLEAIENSDYKTVPAFPYGVGFIRSYANYLGLNGENIAELYKEETNISLSKDMRVLEPQQEASMPGIKYLVISLLAIVLVYSGWTIFNDDDEFLADENFMEQLEDSSDSGVVVVEEFNFEQTADSETISGEADDNISEQTEPQESLPQESSSVLPKAESVSSEIKESVENTKPQALTTEQAANVEAPAKQPIPSQGIFIEISEETWVEIKDDIKLYLSKVLQPGDTYKVPNKKGLILSVGKDNGINVYINGVLTSVVRPNKRMNIALDPFLDEAQ